MSPPGHVAIGTALSSPSEILHSITDTDLSRLSEIGFHFSQHGAPPVIPLGNSLHSLRGHLSHAF